MQRKDMPKRDLERFREIIIEVSEMPSRYDDGLVEFQEKMKAGDQYQLYLMQGAGLIEGKAAKEGIFFITNAGADFYDSVKDNTSWQKTKIIAKKAGSFTLESVIEVAKSVAANAVTTVLLNMQN